MVPAVHNSETDDLYLSFVSLLSSWSFFQLPK